ncbi:MAG: nucleotidyltransferase family protein [Anaerolineae bacterium]|nr:nucleotidyltransferase family protein [Anaerolineae bacterium]
MTPSNVDVQQPQSAQQLLLLVSRRSLTNDERGQVLAAIERGISWPLFYELARAHGLAPLVFHNLRALNVAANAPAAVWRQFEASYYSTLGDNLLLESELFQAADQLRRREVDFLLLKGIVLGAMLYPDPALRPSADLDIMVPLAQVAAAQQALQDLGYSLQPGRQLDFQLARSYDIPYVRQSASGQGVLLELHWSLAEPELFNLDIDNLWARAQPFAYNGHALRSLSPEDILFHLTIHIRKHRYVGLRWLVDVNEMLRSFGAGLDWAYLLNLAQQTGACTLLYMTLQLTHDVMAAPVPQHVLDTLRPSRVRRFLLKPFVDAQNLTRIIQEDSAEWSWLGLGQVLLLDRFRAMSHDLRHRFAPPINIFPGQTRRDHHGLLYATWFYVSRLGMILGRMGRAGSRRLWVGLRRRWNRA